MFRTFLASLLLLCLIVCSHADNCTNSQQCALIPAVTSSLGMMLIAGNQYWYCQQRFGPPLVSEKCWSSSLFLSDFSILENAMNAKWTFYDPREQRPATRVKMNVVSNSAKFYLVFDNKEITITNLIVTPDLLAASFCSDSRPTVLIFTSRKERDEDLIQSAVRRLKKIVPLPSPAVNMDCDKLVCDV